MEDKLQVELGVQAKSLLDSQAAQQAFLEMEEHLNRLVWQCQAWEEYRRLQDQRQALDVFKSILNASMVRGEQVSELLQMVKNGIFPGT